MIKVLIKMYTGNHYKSPRYEEAKAPEAITKFRPEDCAHGVLNISNPVGIVWYCHYCDHCDRHCTSIMLATISDVWVQGAKLQRPRHHPRQLQYMQLSSNILIWVIIIVIMISILCNIANFEGVKTQNWLHGGSLLYQPMPCRGGGPSGGMRHWFHASIEPSSFDDSSP